MAAHVKVFREGTQNLIFNRIFPDSVSVDEANQRVRDYIKAEGINRLFGLDRHTYRAEYSKYVLKKPIKFGIDSDEPDIVHIMNPDTKGKTFCGIEVSSTFKSDVRYTESCPYCVSNGGFENV